MLKQFFDDHQTSQEPSTCNCMTDKLDQQSYSLKANTELSGAFLFHRPVLDALTQSVSWQGAKYNNSVALFLNTMLSQK